MDQFGRLVLHLCETFEGIKASDAFQLLILGDDNHSSLLMDIHERFDTSSINEECIGHGTLFKLMLCVHFVDYLENDLFHHEGRGIG